MPHIYTLELTLSRTEERKVLEGNIPDDQWERLICYREDADRLADALMSCASRKVSMHITISQGQIASKIDTPSPQDRAALLHALRPFVLERERWSFDRTCGLVGQIFAHGWMRRAMRWIRDHYRSVHFQSKLTIVAGDVVLNTERTFSRAN